MKLIIGLGNPGKEYENTRHNTGFMVLDRLSEKLNIEMTQNKFKGLYGKSKYKGEDVILLKPQTYMNLSGESVRQVMDFFKINQEDILVIYEFPQKHLKKRKAKRLQLLVQVLQDLHVPAILPRWDMT